MKFMQSFKNNVDTDNVVLETESTNEFNMDFKSIVTGTFISMSTLDYFK